LDIGEEESAIALDRNLRSSQSPTATFGYIPQPALYNRLTRALSGGGWMGDRGLLTL